MRLKVGRYNAQEYYHWCKDELGNTRRVDICVDGGLKELAINPKDLEGLEVECDSIHEYVGIANGVKIVSIP